jgi:hypothetical protein
MPIQQMLLGAAGAEDDVFQIRVWQAASSVGDGEWRVTGFPQHFFQYSDGSYLLCAQADDATNVQTDHSKHAAMCITNDKATGFAKSVNHWCTSDSADRMSIYPYRGSRTSGKDMTIFSMYGFGPAWQGGGDNRDGRWFMIQDSLSNNCANLKKWNWHPSGYWSDASFTLRSKDGSDNEYWFACQDSSSSPATRDNVRWGKMTISSSAISMNSCRRLGGNNRNGTGLETWTSDDDYLYIHGVNQETHSRSKPFIMKCTASGITWYREHQVGSQNCYGGGCCEVDSSGNVYYVARHRKNNAWQPVIKKLNSSGTTQWSVSWDDDHDCFGSAINGSKLYLCWRDSSDIIITEHDTSDGSINWQNKIDLSTYTVQFQKGSMQLNKDNNLDIYAQMGDSGSVIYDKGAALFSGIPSDGSLGNGKVGSQITYVTSTSIPTPSSYTSFSTGTSISSLQHSSISADDFDNYTGNALNSNNTDSQLTNINKN